MFTARTLVALLTLALHASSAAAALARPMRRSKTCHVKAKGFGGDDGPAINAAFKSCANGGKVVLDGYYVVDTLLLTTGLKNVEIELSGTVQYTPDIARWSPESLFLTYQNATTAWFLSGENIHMYGGGTIDGNGQVWWEAGATGGPKGVAGGSSRAFARPIPLTVGNASHVLIENINSYQSPFWHNFVYQSSYVTYQNININSTSFSDVSASNTDGWDIYRSDHVTIRDSNINNGDDCVSFKPNTTNTLVSHLFCNGSHGISVGSLGQYAGETDIVANITVEYVIMNNTENGSRIKVFGGSGDPNSVSGGGNGFVKNVTYSHFETLNVQSPIVLLQCYETPAAQCAQFPSKVTISDVHYSHVTGTSDGSLGGLVVDLECSGQCQDITAVDTHLTSPNGTATYICKNIASVSELDFGSKCQTS